MTTIFIALIIFLNILEYFVIFDVILSWLAIFWINFRPKFIASVMDPIYSKIKSILPTTIWPLDLTPIIVIFAIIFLKSLIFVFFPEISSIINNLYKWF